MRAVNPIRILRNRQIEAVIEASNSRDDDVFFRLACSKASFEESDAFKDFEKTPQANEIVHTTFVGLDDSRLDNVRAKAFFREDF